MPFWAANTDWYDEITDPAVIMNHDLGISGGTENARFYAGFGSINQSGIILFTHNTRYNARINSDFTFLDGRITAGESFSFSNRNALNVPNLSEGSPVHVGPYRSQAIIPVIITRDVNGMFHDFVPGEWGGTGIASRLGDTPNPVADLTRNKDNYFIDNRLTGNLYVDINIINGLDFRSRFGGTIDAVRENIISSPTYERAYNNITNRTVTGISSRNNSWVWTNTLTFEKKFGNHKMLALAGHEALKYDIGNAVVNTDTSLYTETRMLSSFIKADYSFMDRYLLGITLRRDGCSRFSESQRFAYFPSFSAGWQLSNEPFMESLSWITDLKIRGSWGRTGNQFAISPGYAAYIFGTSIGGSYYDLYGTFNSAVPGYYPMQTGNPDVKWEESVMTDIGLDAGLFGDRISIIFDWYSMKSGDLLYNPPVAGTAGQANPPFVNIGSMKNTGIDIEVSYRDKWGDLGFSGSLIFTKYNNEITGLSESVKYFSSGNSEIGSIVRNGEGQPLSSFYGYKVAGIFKNMTDVENSADQNDAQPGLLKFENQDTLTNVYWLWVQERYKRKNFIDYRDKTFIGNPNPDFTYSLDLALSWKNFDISAFFYGSQGNEIFNFNKWYTDFWSSGQGQKSKTLLYDSWTASKTDAAVPKATNHSGFSSNGTVCSYYIEDGSYLRLKSLQIGYSLPSDLVRRIRIESLRVYLQAVNLFTLTKYSGLDPEIGGNDLASGIDYGNYPNVKQFLFGINLSL
jgi:TonB-linked SusC/RagA family outer membrane protein